MTILVNLLKSIGIISLSIVFAFVIVVTREFSTTKKEDGMRKLIVFSITLGIIGGIIFSILAVWLK